MTKPATFGFAALAAVLLAGACFFAYRRWGAIGTGAWLLGVLSLGLLTRRRRPLEGRVRSLKCTHNIPAEEARGRGWTRTTGLPKRRFVLAL